MKADLRDTPASKGIYPVAQAARLIGVPPRIIRRFIWGYETGGTEYAPVFSGDYVGESGLMAISFLDMMEVRILRALRKRQQSLSLQTWRRISEKAARLLGTAHPFSSRRIRVLGPRVFADIEPGAGEGRLLEILTNQLNLRAILDPFLSDLDYGGDDLACRWWPLGRNHRVVIDPARSFGRPIPNESGVPTRILAEAAAANGAMRAAEWYELDPAEVEGRTEI